MEAGDARGQQGPVLFSLGDSWKWPEDAAVSSLVRGPGAQDPSGFAVLAQHPLLSPATGSSDAGMLPLASPPTRTSSLGVEADTVDPPAALDSPLPVNNPSNLVSGTVEYLQGVGTSLSEPAMLPSGSPTLDLSPELNGGVSPGIQEHGDNSFDD